MKRFLIVMVTLAAMFGAVSAAQAQNPFAGTHLYVLKAGQAGADAADQIQAWSGSASHARESAALSKIAGQPWAEWYGDWLADPGAMFASASARGTRRTMPPRSSRSTTFRIATAGPRSRPAARRAPPHYRAWIQNMAAAIGSYPTIVVLEPDGIMGAPCLGGLENQRLQLLSFAAKTLSALPHTSVYIDAGRSGALPANQATSLLRRAGVGYTRGFALDTTGYATTANELRYGDQIGRALGNKHFIVNTSRNGNGTLPLSQATQGKQELWCNTPNRALGAAPTTNTHNRLADAFEWILHPGYSDGLCQGGGPAGSWWLPYAIGLAERAHY